MTRLFIASLAAAATLALGAAPASADRFPSPPGAPLITGGGDTSILHCDPVLGIPGVIVENQGVGTINNCQFG